MYLQTYILNNSILRVRTGAKTFVIYISLRTATRVAETFRGHIMFIVYYNILLKAYMHLLISSPYLINVCIHCNLN